MLFLLKTSGARFQNGAMATLYALQKKGNNLKAGIAPLR
jgi:hypothetical protein